jgi:4-amino-4-deoxy-L-arabinose transferase-like glycosyltransferase
MSPLASETVLGATVRRVDPYLVLILLVASLLRFQLATTQEYIHDENNTSIPLSQTISFAPGHVHLPIRGENHGALPAYVVKASGTLFGTTPLGYRTVHVLGGLVTVLMIYVLASQWYGPVAARWAAALLAFNEYYLGVSARATAHVPHLFLVAAAIYAFSRFLKAQRPVYLYVAGACAGLAFYCKEHSALLLPAFFLALLQANYRRWLISPHVYLAALVFALMIGPDLYWNATMDRQTARIDYGTQVAGYANYRSHLQRIGGLGLSPYPLMFYGRTAVRSTYAAVTGRELRDETEEYRSMNPLLGVLLLASVVITTFRPAVRHPLQKFLILYFWIVFGLFTLIARGDPPGRLDPVSWIWVEATILPAVILTGAFLASTRGKWRVAVWAVSGVALLYPLLGS